MSEAALSARTGWFQIISSTVTAVVVGYTSTVLIVLEAARAVGASASQQASWIAALCLGMAVTTVILSWRYRMPILTAWSTPGAVLIATSAEGISYAEALGAFVVAGLLMFVAGLVKPFEQAIERMPATIAAAMLAGVLLRYSLGVPGAALSMPYFILPLIIIYFALRHWLPFFAAPVVVVAGVIMALSAGSLDGACCSFAITPLVWTTPSFNGATVLSLGVPLFLVTMASQNLPGFAVLRASGYQPPVSGSLLVTGAASAITAPFGSHAVNLAAITASIVSGPDCHPDPHKRWLVAWPYFLLYGAVGLMTGSIMQLLGALPAPLITAIAGLALFSPLMGAMIAMVKEPGDIEGVLVTFLVTASGVTIAGIGSAFWGLMAGLALFGVRNFRSKAMD